MKEWRKDYIISGEEFLSLTNFFPLEKAEGISMVYKGTSKRLDKLLWGTNFMLPTIFMQIRAIQLGTSMGDIDIGKKFFNFMMHKSFKNNSGVVITNKQSEDPT